MKKLACSLLVLGFTATACGDKAPQTVATKSDEITTTTVVSVETVETSTTLVHEPFIPGPPKPGEKLAPIPPDPTIKPGKLPACPVEGAVTTKLLAGGCVGVPGPGSMVADRVRLNGLLNDECQTGAVIIEIGPSAPRPLGWGILDKGFHWGIGNTYDNACHGTSTPVWYQCQVFHRPKDGSSSGALIIDAGYPTRQECFDIAARSNTTETNPKYSYVAVVGTEGHPIP